KMFSNKAFILMGNIQPDMPNTQALNFIVDCACDNIAWCKFGALVKTQHKAFAIGQTQISPFAAHCFSDQEGARLWMIEAGRMELVKFPVSHPAVGTIGHGNAVTRGNIWI